MSRIKEALVFKTDKERLEWFYSLAPEEQAEVAKEAKELVMTTMKKLLLITIIFLTACASQVQQSATNAPAVSVPSAIPSATNAPTATITSSATPSPTTAPLILPVGLGTPVPDLAYQVITPANASRLQQVARWGHPVWNHAERLTDFGKSIAVSDGFGITFYDAASQVKTGYIPAEFASDFDITPNGQTILTKLGDTLTILNRAGEVRKTFTLSGVRWGSFGLQRIALSVDGRFLAVFSDTGRVDDRAVFVYDMDGIVLEQVRGEGSFFTPDGRFLSVFFDGSVYLYAMAEIGRGSWAHLPKMNLPWCHSSENRCDLVFSPDGVLAALVHQNRVELYQVDARKLIRSFDGWSLEKIEKYGLPAVSFSPDGKRVLVAVDTAARVYDIASGEVVAKGDAAPEGALTWTDGTQVKTFVAPLVQQYHPWITWDADFRVSNSGDVRYAGWVWDDDSHGMVSITCQNNVCAKLPSLVVFNEDGKQYPLVSTGNERASVTDTSGAVLYSLSTRGLISAEIYKGYLLAVYVSNRTQWLAIIGLDGRKYKHAQDYYWIVRGEDYLLIRPWRGVTKRFDFETFSEQTFSDKNAPNSDAPPFSMALSDAVSFYTLRFSTDVIVTDNQTGEVIYKFPAAPDYYSVQVSVSPDGRLLVTYGSDSIMRVWAILP